MKVVDSNELRAWIDANERDEATPPPVPDGDPVPVGISGNWTLVFRDEFDGPALDTTVWNPNWLGAPGTITKPVNSAELCAYDPAQVEVRDGCLRLTAIDKPVVAADGKTYQYRSGLIESYRGSDNKGRMFTYGVFEARILMPSPDTGMIPFNWGAFWLNGKHDDWPDHGETDTMENLSNGPAWHYHSPSGSVAEDAPSGDWTGWHTYAVEWSKGRLRFWYDGLMIGEVTEGVLDFPQYLVCNYGISTEHGGPLAVPNTLLVDYVRVWEAATPTA